MSIKIRWGAPGSYKTSAAVATDFWEAVIQGRTIVTNIRGLHDPAHIKRVIESRRYPNAFSPRPKVPDSFTLIHLATHEHEHAAENREYLARWFHWLPKGALLLLDEAQDIWPKRWTQKQIDLFDYPGGVDQASKDKRPANFNQAFEMHRHHGWDIVLTTPDISLLRPDIRATCEGAFRHDNQAFIGLKGFHMQTFHLASNRGSSRRDQLSVWPLIRVPSAAFDLYKSTATGEVKDTIAGSSFFKNPKFIGLTTLLFLTVAYLVHLGPPKVLLPSGDKPIPKVAEAPPKSGVESPSLPVSQDRPSPVAGNPRNVGAVSDSAGNPLIHPLQGFRLRISGYTVADKTTTYHFEAEDKESQQYLKDSDLYSMGYTLYQFNRCLIRITYQTYQGFVSCRKFRPVKDSPETYGETVVAQLPQKVVAESFNPSP